MSLAAQVWVSSLPLEVGLNLAAFRVLDKLADAHNTETDAAWRTVDRIASELRCSKRTIQRALKDLQLLGFIERGDQRLVGHLRGDRHPTVWRLALGLWRDHRDDQPELDGVTAVVTPSGPVDNSHGVTTVVAHGVTTAVALGTGFRTSREIPSATTERASGEHAHQFLGRFCELCGLDPARGERMDFKTGLVKPAAS